MEETTLDRDSVVMNVAEFMATLPSVGFEPCFGRARMSTESACVTSTSGGWSKGFDAVKVAIIVVCYICSGVRVSSTTSYILS